MKKSFALALLSVFLIALDQYFKYLIRQHSNYTSYLVNHWFGVEYFSNPGVAFGLPIPSTIILFLTPIVLLGLGILLMRSIQKTEAITFALIFILGGAISNYIDRVLFGATIDYLRVLTGVINVADIMIAIGFGILIFGHQNKTT